MVPGVWSTLRGGVLAAIAAAFVSGSAFAQGLPETVAFWEQRLQARIGYELRDVSSDWQMSGRAEERFAMSSTFKVLLCGAILARVDAGTEDLNTLVAYQAGDLVRYSPITETRVETGMRVGELCEATITISDNTAANLLLDRIGGPAGLTTFLRRNGDPTTRLDRPETEVNEATPMDPRDTTTPRAMLTSLDAMLFGDVLQPSSALQLAAWMINDRVADALIRAHLPQSWRIGDKTGAGGHGSRSIVAFLQTPVRGTYLVAIYLTDTDADFALRNRAVSDIGRAMIAEIKQRPGR